MAEKTKKELEQEIQDMRDQRADFDKEKADFKGQKDDFDKEKADFATKEEEQKETLIQIRDLGAVDSTGKSFDKYNQEMKEIRSQANDSNPSSIEVQDFADHKNISLWTKDGKRIGPMHPVNVERTFKRNWDKGRILSTKPPTPEEIEAYKKTDEYVLAHEELLKIREQRKLTLKKGEFERLTKMMALQMGKTVSEISAILTRDQVKGA